MKSLILVSALSSLLTFATAQSASPNPNPVQQTSSPVGQLVQIIEAIPLAFWSDTLTANEVSSLSQVVSSLSNSPFLTDDQAQSDINQIKSALTPDHLSAVLQQEQYGAQPIIIEGMTTNVFTPQELYASDLQKLSAFLAANPDQ